MYLEGIMLSEISQIAKDKYNLVCMWTLKKERKKKKIKKFNENEKKITDLWLPEAEGGGGGELEDGGQSVQAFS